MVKGGLPGGDPTTPQERGAVAAWILCSGKPLTTKEMADRLRMTKRGARMLLNRLSRVLPIYRDQEGMWRRVHPKHNRDNTRGR